MLFDIEKSTPSLTLKLDKPIVIRLYEKPFLRRTALIFLGLIVWSIFVIPTFILYKNEGLVYSVPVGYNIGNTSNDRIDASITIIDFDLIKRKFSVFVSFSPTGKYLLSNNSLSEPMNMQLGYESKTFKPNELMNTFTMTVPLITGNTRDYPFDNYEVHMPISFVSEEGIEIAKKITVSPFVQSLSIKTKYIVLNEAYGLHFTITRSTTTLLFSGFVTMLMWALSISIINVAWDVIVLNIEAPPTVLTMGISTIFALPALRSSQPGIPSIGCLIDVLGFFWNMLLIALSCVAVIWTWTFRWKCQNRKYNISIEDKL